MPQPFHGCGCFCFIGKSEFEIEGSSRQKVSPSGKPPQAAAAACGAPPTAELLPPHRAALCRRAEIWELKRRYEACFGEHSLRYVKICCGKFDYKYNGQAVSNFVRVGRRTGGEPAHLCRLAETAFGCAPRRRQAPRGRTNAAAVTILTMQAFV